ncbi:hypothetical protein RJ639_001612 [Escallonia herrerae]|uniref:Kinesin motor domain-containing protein n=1 Tax=Escallonia herrerae TaxID=1293975 RepID=A0AA88XBC2_9ASTE|nr:hypothetical protein RJ639_001612 [Escallonia herrerae]
MTLGTVIKKLSESAESQGSHVPYRDSKLTRILQPALGGNANTAIICNITLAQIHADETKSSLQFASRALRVTNCVHVNEYISCPFKGSHSEHFEEEILNLRNTLLQMELERERIALELEEEKKTQAAREKRLQEQAKKIENLSSMVLCSNRDENRDRYKKITEDLSGEIVAASQNWPLQQIDVRNAFPHGNLAEYYRPPPGLDNLQEKRRDTWCPGNLSNETLREALMD